MDITAWKKRKKELKWNYQKIADEAGVSKRTIEDIFRGFTTTPRIDTVEAIERALGITPTWTYEDRAAGISDTKMCALTPEEEDTIYLYREIGKKKGAAAQAVALGMWEKILEL